MSEPFEWTVNGRVVPLRDPKPQEASFWEMTMAKNVVSGLGNVSSMLWELMFMMYALATMYW
jgi:hypothetical protein